MKRDKKLNDKLHKNDILSKEVNKRVRENEALLKEQKGYFQLIIRDIDFYLQMKMKKHFKSSKKTCRPFYPKGINTM